MKKTVIFVVFLFLLVGVVSASGNFTGEIDDTLSVNDSQVENLTHAGDIPIGNETPSTDETPDGNGTNSSNEPPNGNVSADNNQSDGNSTPVEKPKITTSTVTGTQGKYITLKAVVKNSTGPVSGVKVTFKLNGKTYTAVSNAQGIASVKVKCPASKAVKTTTKKTSKRLTKTTTYKKTYTCTASSDGSSSNFKVISKKAKLVKKYKIIKKQKTMKVPLKKGSKTFKKGKYKLLTYKGTNSGVNVFGALMTEKNTAGTIKFTIKMRFKENGVLKWSKTYKVKRNGEYTTWYPKFIKVDKIKVKYTQVSYKRIK